MYTSLFESRREWMLQILRGETYARSECSFISLEKKQSFRCVFFKHSDVPNYWDPKTLIINNLQYGISYMRITFEIGAFYWQFWKEYFVFPRNLRNAPNELYWQKSILTLPKRGVFWIGNVLGRVQCRNFWSVFVGRR